MKKHRVVVVEDEPAILRGLLDVLEVGVVLIAVGVYAFRAGAGGQGAAPCQGGQGVAHRLAEGESAPAVGTRLTAEVDWPRRYRLMRMHSAMHLLCKAVDCPVTGGQVGEERSRLDFDPGETRLDKDAIAARLAEWVALDRPIRHLWIDAGELQSRPELVRTMSVRPPTTGGRLRLVEIEGLDLQACGGTHVRSTGEIGALSVGKIENKGRQNRRVNIALAD